MAMNFPDSPSNGDTITLNSKEYIYTSASNKWSPVAIPGPAGPAGVAGSASSSTAISMNQSGAVTVTIGTAKWYAPDSITITKVAARLGSVATGSTVATINKNGVVMQTLTILSGSAETIDTTGFTMTTGQYITIDVTSIGSPPGADLNVQIVYNFN